MNLRPIRFRFATGSMREARKARRPNSSQAALPDLRFIRPFAAFLLPCFNVGSHYRRIFSFIATHNHDKGHSSRIVPARMPLSCCATLRLQRLLELFGQKRHDFEQVADDAIVGNLEDRRFRILVNRDDDTRLAHAGHMLDRAADAAGDV